MPLRNSVKAVFFDLDDTLCAYWDAVKSALPEAWKAAGHDSIEPAQFVLTWASCFRKFCPTVKKSDWQDIYYDRGEPTRTELMRLTIAALGLSDDVDERELGDTYADLRARRLTLFPDAIMVLDQFKEQFPLGLITNGPADVQRSEVNDLGIASYFDPILIEGELRFGKPNKRVFGLAEEHCGYAPDEILMVGNSYAHDIVPAIEAGWQTAWIRRESDVPPSSEDVNPKPEELPDGAPLPTLIVESLTELAHVTLQ